jgi:hypothetical protein
MLKFRRAASHEMPAYQWPRAGLSIALCVYHLMNEGSQMTVKFENEPYARHTTIRVSGRLRSKHLDELKVQLAGAQSRIVLDLNGVTLVDIEVVRFLNDCEDAGVELLNCWPYIREWMNRENETEE